MTQKQLAFISYITKRLGFSTNDFTKDFLYYLSLSANNFKNYRAISLKAPLENNDRRSDDETLIRGEEVYKQDIKKGLWLPEKYSVIDFLVDEYKLKKNNSTERIEQTKDKNNLVTATNLSSFSFCPASYSIQNTFQTKSTILANTGTRLHEQIRLGKAIKKEKHVNEFIFDEKDKKLLNEIMASELLYSGHNNKDKKYFINTKKTFAGQPDYIFKNKNGEVFIVEEKFQRAKFNSLNDYQNDKYKNTHFHESHKTQLYSYIYGLEEFKPKYGYLVYWIYREIDSKDWFEPNKLRVSKCIFKRYDKSESMLKKLNKIYLKIKQLRQGKSINFNPDTLNPKKCANCAVNRYCGHKAGRFKELRFPYEKEYHKVWSTEYPEILKKEFNEESPIQNSENNITYEDIFYSKSNPFYKKSSSYERTQSPPIATNAPKKTIPNSLSSDDKKTSK